MWASQVIKKMLTGQTLGYIFIAAYNVGLG